MQSIVQERGAVRFPEFRGDRVHMLTVYRDKPLPVELKHWQLTFNDMLEGINTDGPVYLMIDQKAVKAGKFHRRRGIHIDGFWVPGTLLTGGRYPDKHGVWAGGHGHGQHRSDDDRPYPSPGFKAEPWERERPTPGFNSVGVTMQAAGGWHMSEQVTPGFKTREQLRQDRTQSDRNKRIRDRLKNIPKNAQSEIETFWPNETILLASDVPACRALVGEYEGPIGKGGDLTHLDLSHMREIMFEANKVYAGNVTFAHESLPVLHDCQRTVVRINVPGHIIH